MAIVFVSPPDFTRSFLKKMLTFLGLLLVVAIVGATTTAYLISEPTYQGPVSDHFDGKAFFNPNGRNSAGFLSVVKWMSQRQAIPWGAFRESKKRAAPPAKIEGDSIHVTFVNHSTVLIQMAGLNILTDPIFEKRVSPFSFAGPARNCPPGITFDQLPPIDILLLSHNHWDHLEIGTVKKIYEKWKPKVYVPLGVGQFLQKHGIRSEPDMDWYQSAIYDAQTTIHCVQAQHFSGRGLFDRNGTLWVGYIVENKQAGKAYFVGDTGYGEFFKKIGQQYGPINVSLIPIGAFRPEWFMSPIHCSPVEAVQIHQDVQSEQSVAIHFGTFPLADDGETEPVETLQKTLIQKGITPTRFVALEEGQTLVIPPK